MSLEVAFIVWYWSSFLVGCIIVYIKHRKDKKEQDKIITEIVKRHMYISED